MCQATLPPHRWGKNWERLLGSTTPYEFTTIDYGALFWQQNSTNYLNTMSIGAGRKGGAVRDIPEGLRMDMRYPFITTTHPDAIIHS